ESHKDLLDQRDVGYRCRDPFLVFEKIWLGIDRCLDFPFGEIWGLIQYLLRISATPISILGVGFDLIELRSREDSRPITHLGANLVLFFANRLDEQVVDDRRADSLTVHDDIYAFEFHVDFDPFFLLATRLALCSFLNA